MSLCVDWPRYARGSRWLYFISTVARGPIKIGMSNNPVARLSGLQTSHWEELCIIAARDYGDIGALAAERQLHDKFCHYRIRGEWFQRNEYLLCEMESLCGGNSFSGNPITMADAHRWHSEVATP